jgi:zinc protease
LIRLALAALLFLVAPLAPVAAMNIERVVSPGGIEAWLVHEESIPVIIMEVAWKGGSASDPAEKSGLANMVSALLDEGAGDLDSAAFQERMDDIAARISFSAESDHFRGSLQTLAKERDEAFRLFSLAISRPRFDEDAVERIRAQIATIVARNQDRPDWIVEDTWYKSALGDHPYARAGEGTPESITQITQADLAGYTQRTLARDNLKIAVVGPVSAAELGTLLDKSFGALPEKAELPTIPNVELSAHGEVVVVVRDFPQSVILFGSQGLARDDEDFIPAFVMNYILGGGSFSSRLMEEVRVKRGLAYSVGTYLHPRNHAAFFFGEVGTKNERVGETLAIVRRELSTMAKDGVTEAELQDAKTYLTGSYPLRFTSNRSIANQLLGIQIENLGIDYVEHRNELIEAVTREDIARVAARLLKPENLLVTIVGKPDLSTDSGLPERDDMAPAPSAHPSEMPL